MKLFDSHSHINDPCFDKDYDEVLTRAHNADIKAIMIIGTDVATSQKALDLAIKSDTLFSSVGIHPHDTKNCSMEDIKTLKKIALNPSVKAWGETGLDFNRMHSSAIVQEKWFKEQLDAAKELKLPLIFHERESGGRLLEILKSGIDLNLTGVIHCFSGSKDELSAYLDLGYYIGITGIITMKKRGALLRELVPMIPDNRILVETDCPYLTPAPTKNKVRRNEPEFVKFIFSKIAEIKNINPDVLADKIWDNTCKLFNIHTMMGPRSIYSE